MLSHLRQQRLSQRDIATANEDGGVLEILGPAREYGTVHQLARLLELHRTIAADLVRPRVHGDDAVECARLRIAIELDEDLALVHGCAPPIKPTHCNAWASCNAWAWRRRLLLVVERMRLIAASQDFLELRLA